MSPRIVFVTDFPDAADVAREMAPSGFELVIAPARSAEYKEAMREAEYLVGFVDGLVDEELYGDGPKLRLVQLLSAGYDKADIAAARKAGVPIANNGGANSVAVSEHAILLMLSDPNVEKVLVNIFGGILRCDIAARGIVDAYGKADRQPPTVVRMLGTNVDEGKQILADSGLSVTLVDTLEEAAAAIK